MSSNKSIPCPACGSAVTRRVTRKELRQRNGGQDPLVVVMPRACPGCGHVWEPPPSRGACYAVAAVAGVGFLVGLAVAAVSLSALAGAAGPANTQKNRSGAVAVGLTGIALATGAGVMGVKYLQLARARPHA